MEENNFQEVFIRLINSANVATSKAEDKLLQDEQYIPPSGHISLLMGKVINISNNILCFHGIIIMVALPLPALEVVLCLGSPERHIRSLGGRSWFLRGVYIIF